jgi:hypothetical protein
MSRSSRCLSGLAFLAIGCAIGCTKKEAAVSPELHPIPKGIFAIIVGPKPDDLSHKKVQISKLDAEVVFWVAKKKTDTLRIEFEEELFEGMTEQQSNGRWVPKDCGMSRACYSGDIKDTTIPSPTVEHVYWQVLTDRNSQEHPADGMIIINP